LSNKLACSSIACRKPWIINDAHELLCHPGKDTTQTELECQSRNNGGVLSLYCGQGKANVVQFSLYEKSQSPGERFFINLSSVGPPEGEVALQKLIVERLSSN